MIKINNLKVNNFKISPPPTQSQSTIKNEFRLKYDSKEMDDFIDYDLYNTPIISINSSNDSPLSVYQDSNLVGIVEYSLYADDMGYYMFYIRNGDITLSYDKDIIIKYENPNGYLGVFIHEAIPLIELDVSNTQINELESNMANYLTALNVTNCSMLENLDLNQTIKLENVDLQGCINLGRLQLVNTNVTKVLNLDKCKKLYKISVLNSGDILSETTLPIVESGRISYTPEMPIDPNDYADTGWDFILIDFL